MKSSGLILAFLFLSADLVLGQADPVSKFAARSHPYQGRTLPYRIFVPEPYQMANRYPLLLALHGSGERGTNNLAQLQANKMATAWVDPAVQAKSPCFVVAPQCPPTLTWSQEILTLHDLLDSLGREFSLDSNRLYITGLSMGGYGTFDMLMAYPTRFAAAVPMSGGGTLQNAHLIKDIPIWDFHGTLDDAVPVSESRNMIRALEDQGRSAVYTHCHSYDCSGMPDSLVAMHVRSHADLFYTEYPNGGHVIWDEAYTTPLLSDWLFDKHRLTPDAVRLNEFSSYRSVAGYESISWEGGAPEDSVEIWMSPDAGGHWHLIAPLVPNTGTFDWNTEREVDCALALLNIFLKNKNGHAYARDESRPFSINNGANGSPFVRVNTPGVEPGMTLTADSLLLHLLCADPEGDSLVVRILYSSDQGATFEGVDSLGAPSDTLPFARPVGLSARANSEDAMIKVEAFDGAATGTATLARFAKRSVRLPGPVANRTSGGGGTVTVHVVNPAQLTGHLYRVSFASATYGAKNYRVTDVDDGRTVVQSGSPLDGRGEGPLFDGVRLVVKDVERAELNAAETHWLVGSPTSVDVSVYLPRINLPGILIQGHPEPADYDVTFDGQVVDTSSGEVLGLPAMPVKFSVMNLTQARRSKFIYVDSDNSGSFTSVDEIYILEPDSLSRLRITWAMMFVATPGRTLPQAGDRFALRTVKPITSQDVFEFRTVMTRIEEQGLPMETRLWANYPNPFNPKTTIEYTVAGLPPTMAGGRADGGKGAARTRLVIYDLLGREVTILVDEERPPGTYRVTFDGSALASGVYFFRLSVGSFIVTRKALLLR